MHKECECGQLMNIRLRTVIFQNKIEIENVPVYSCENCSRSEVYPPVKRELIGLIGRLEDTPNKQLFQFDELCELAHLFRRITDPELEMIPTGKIIEMRVNELLDLLLLAQSLDDISWQEDIRFRLSQLTTRTLGANLSI
jgi:YgiT-type zinc finger domain-containing protein